MYKLLSEDDIYVLVQQIDQCQSMTTNDIRSLFSDLIDSGSNFKSIELMMKNPTINNNKHMSKTFIKKAIYGNNPRALNLLLQHSQKIYLNNDFFTHALKRNYLEIVKILLSGFDAQLGTERNMSSFLRMSILKNNCDAVKLLLQNAKSKSLSVSEDIFNYALKNNLGHIIKTILLEIKADSKLNYCAIKTMAECGNHEIVEFLLYELGVDPSIDDNYPIRVASKNGHTRVVELLLNDVRVNPTARDNYAIKWAAYKGWSEIIKLFLAIPEINFSIGNNYPIIIAAEYHHTEVVRLLMASGKVDPSDDNNNAIITACENGYTDIVQLLLTDNRVDPSVDNNDALCFASEFGYTDIVRILLKDNSVNPSDNNNYAIRLASKNGHIEIVKLLMSDHRFGFADITDIYCAIANASEKDHNQIVELLKQKINTGSNLAKIKQLMENNNIKKVNIRNSLEVTYMVNQSANTESINVVINEITKIMKSENMTEVEICCTELKISIA